MTAAVERNDSTDATEAHERTEPTPRKLPIDANESAEPMERIEPTEPMHRIEPAELTDRIESVELIDQRDLRPGRSMPTSVTRPGGTRLVWTMSVSSGALLRGPDTPQEVWTALPAPSTTYQRPPALVSPWPVALPGARSGGHR
jgi:hypothetical protein